MPIPCQNGNPSNSSKGGPVNYDINLPYSALSEESSCTTKHPEYLPTWDKLRFKPLPPFGFEDPTLCVTDKPLPNLLTGISLHGLSDKGKHELAYLISQRQGLAFPDQDLIEVGPEAQQEFMKYFHKPNYQPVSGMAKDHPDFHIIRSDGTRVEISRSLEEKTTTTLWAQDVNHEAQPPGCHARRLSAAFQEFLDGLSAMHSFAKMINHVRVDGGLARKDSADNPRRSWERRL